MPKKLPVVLNEEERFALLGQPNRRYVTGHRNYMIMTLMFNLGLRLSEAINLKWADIDLFSNVLMVREGKGKKDRTLYIQDKNWRGEDDKHKLEIWRGRLVEHFDGKLPEYVFPTLKGASISPRYVQQMIARYYRRAGISKHVTPHTLRHTFATDLYRKRKDIAVVKNTLGHSNISTTMVYVHLIGSDVQKALSGDEEGDK